MNFLFDLTLSQVIETGTIVVTACAAIAAITPTKVDDRALMRLGKIYNITSRIVNVAGLNVGKAKNKDDD